MERSETIGALAAALAKAQGAMEGASKDRTNPHFKSKYADLASIWDACRAALSANGLAVMQTTGGKGQEITVRTVLAHSSGEWVASELSMFAAQNTPQAIGSCVTYARRYSLAAMVGVAPEDDDGNAASGKEATPPPSSGTDAAQRQLQETLDRARQVGSGDVFTLQGGKHKGKSITDGAVPTGYLEWLVAQVRAEVENPEKSQYRTQNEWKLKQVEAELQRRTSEAAQ